MRYCDMQGGARIAFSPPVREMTRPRIRTEDRGTRSLTGCSKQADPRVRRGRVAFSRTPSTASSRGSSQASAGIDDFAHAAGGRRLRAPTDAPAAAND